MSGIALNLKKDMVSPLFSTVMDFTASGCISSLSLPKLSPDITPFG
jgi:hypothetical protein